MNCALSWYFEKSEVYIRVAFLTANVCSEVFMAVLPCEGGHPQNLETVRPLHRPLM